MKRPASGWLGSKGTGVDEEEEEEAGPRDDDDDDDDDDAPPRWLEELELLLLLP